MQTYVTTVTVTWKTRGVNCGSVYTQYLIRGCLVSQCRSVSFTPFVLWALLFFFLLKRTLVCGVCIFHVVSAAPFDDIECRCMGSWFDGVCAAEVILQLWRSSQNQNLWRWLTYKNLMCLYFKEKQSSIVALNRFLNVSSPKLINTLPSIAALSLLPESSFVKFHWLSGSFLR